MKRKVTCLVVLLFLSVISIQAQENVKIRRSKFIHGREGFREAWKAVKAGDEAFLQGKGAFKQARQNYLKAWNYNPDVAELNYKLGVCYLFTDDKFQAIAYLKKAFTLKPKVSPDIHFLLGRANHFAMNFDSAIAEYHAYQSSLKPKKRKISDAAIEKYISECENGKKLVAEPVRVIITDMGPSINSEYDDYGSVISPGDSLLFFNSRRPLNKKSKSNPFDHKYYEDIYVSSKTNEGWSEAKALGKSVNTKHDDAVVGIAPAGNTLFIYRGNIKGGDLKESTYKSKRKKWSKPISVCGRFRSRYQETSVAVSPDSSTFYFVSNNPKKSLGGKDIFVSSLKKKGTERWKKARNLGPLINTPYDEEAVNLSPDGTVLYFSSKGHNSMGGYDIFRSVKDKDGNWSAPENIGYPINTPDDELFYAVDKQNNKYAYYSAVRDGGLGGKDIYRIAFLGEAKELIVSVDTQLCAWKKDFPPPPFFRSPEPLVADSSLILRGYVTDAKTGQGIMSRLEFIDVTHNKTASTVISDTSGFYQVGLSSRANYGVEIMAKDYLFFLDVFDLTKDTADLVFIRDFKLSKVEVGTKVVLKNIFFETGKATLKAESFAELSNVQKFLEDNPSVRLEISGHTDNVGSRKVNQRLSEDRAKAVVAYLVSNGIDRSRLEAKGYADTQPVADNNTADGRSQNRRVEFKVIGK